MSLIQPMPEPIVRIVPPILQGQALSRCRIGQYVRFLNPDRQKKPRWTTLAAYQYIGPAGQTGNYARVLDVLTGLIVQIPRKEQVQLLGLVLIELRPVGDPGFEVEEDDPDE